MITNLQALPQQKGHCVRHHHMLLMGTTCIIKRLLSFCGCKVFPSCLPSVALFHSDSTDVICTSQAHHHFKGLHRRLLHKSDAKQIIKTVFKAAEVYISILTRITLSLSALPSSSFRCKSTENPLFTTCSTPNNKDTELAPSL